MFRGNTVDYLEKYSELLKELLVCLLVLLEISGEQ